MRRGFTLIELLVAMAILAVVSVMAVQALGGVFHQRTILTRIDDRDAALIRALSLLRQDLEAAVPAPATDGDDLIAGIEVTSDRLSWRRAGFAEVPGGSRGSYGGVSWTLDDGTLTRLSLRTDGDTDPVQQTTPMLDGVTGMILTPLGPRDAEDSHALAPGYEVILDTETWGPLRLVVAR